MSRVVAIFTLVRVSASEGLDPKPVGLVRGPYAAVAVAVAKGLDALSVHLTVQPVALVWKEGRKDEEQGREGAGCKCGG